MEIKDLPKREAIKKEIKCESPIEETMVMALHELGLYPETQYQIGKYRADIAFPKEMVVIECDGKGWHSTSEQVANDRKRDEFFRENGWHVFRITGSQVFLKARQIAEIMAGYKPRYRPTFIPCHQITDDMSWDIQEVLREENECIRESNEMILAEYRKNEDERKVQTSKDVSANRLKVENIIRELSKLQKQKYFKEKNKEKNENIQRKFNC
jgi:very-short-patch-repair endonuclease